MKTLFVKGGRFKGKEFRLESEISKMAPYERGLPELWFMHGNYAAKNALEIDKYTIEDSPFYYGHIGALGYIISEKDLGIEP